MFVIIKTTNKIVKLQFLFVCVLPKPLNILQIFHISCPLYEPPFFDEINTLLYLNYDITMT